MKVKYDIATIIVNYKSEARTIKYIKEELSKCTLLNLIIVVNNGATSGSSSQLINNLEAVQINDINNPIVTSDNNIFIIHNTDNSGFARGNNLGVEFIRKHFNVEYLLFSNNDIQYIDENVIEQLVLKLSNMPSVGIIGPKLVGLDGGFQGPYNDIPFWSNLVLNLWVRLIPCIKVAKHPINSEDNKAPEGEYYWVMGAFFIAKYSDFIDCGMMDPFTFLYVEEKILSERMLMIGKKTYYYPNCSVLHEHGYTTGKFNIDSSKYGIEGQFHYYKKYRNVSIFSITLAKILRSLFFCLQNIYQKIKP